MPIDIENKEFDINQNFRNLPEHEENPSSEENVENSEKDFDFETKAAELLRREEEIAEREEKLKTAHDEFVKRQQESLNKFAKRNNKLANEEKNFFEHEKRVKIREETLKLKEEELKKLSTQLTEREEKILDLEKKEAELLQREENIHKLEKDLEKSRAEFTRKEQEMQIESVQRRTEEFNNLRAELNAFREQEIKKLNNELEKIRTDAISNADQRLEDLQKQIDERIANTDADLNKRREELEKLQNDFNTEKNNFNAEKKLFEFDRIRIKKLEETLKTRQSEIDSEVKERLEEERQTFETRLQAVKDDNQKLRETLKATEEKLASYESLRAVYGENPDILQNKIQSLQTTCEDLKKELGTRPGSELQGICEQLKQERDQLRAELNQNNGQIGNMQQQVVEVEKLRNTNTILQASNENLHAQWVEAQEIIKNYEAQIKRLTATEMTPADWDKRAASLRESYLTSPFNAPEISSEDAKAVNEIEWLEKIEKNCNDYGITFPRRILYAFHTAFKISNWSTITVLAGVSGTGKSELPRLYSAFGGFNFIGVPVQPNWDSQESMLGFFNSIDNKFDAQPVLKFLVECTEKYSNNMAIVLLDEMNLAHVEHYFADFLSKLETRRSCPENNLPKIYVNLGAGVKPYELPLTRNILWCGTMNQDETTKSLSDKVLDRGIVINFPRPKELKSREGAHNLDNFCKNHGVTPISRQVWNSWRETSVKFDGEQKNELTNYRKLLEEMNNYLSHAGRAIGHRVWQSIEHYVMNYPTVRAEFVKSNGDLTSELKEAIHIAVEDQIVQKVMPKLRGIDTRGNSYENCLVPIKNLLNQENFHLNDDFDRACEMGYGQFIWGSAEYIED